MVDKISFPESHKDVILDFIRLIVPLYNNIPTSYFKIKKSVKKTDIKEFNLSKSCGNLIHIKKENNKKIMNCISEFCTLNSI